MAKLRVLLVWRRPATIAAINRSLLKCYEQGLYSYQETVEQRGWFYRYKKPKRARPSTQER